MSVKRSISSRKPSDTEFSNSSQQATQFLWNIPLSNIPFVSVESGESWTKHENLMLSCLRKGDDKAAHQCLENLIDRFGATSERIMGLRGLFREAVAEDQPALQEILKAYDDVLAEDPGNTVSPFQVGQPPCVNRAEPYLRQPVLKRRVVVLGTLSRTAEAIDALIQLLEASPTDVESWTELSDLYMSKGLYSQAEFCLEEVLLNAPNAWNVNFIFLSDSFLLH